MTNDSTNLITPSMHEGELRILDTDLAGRLGFSQPRDIRKLIARHGGALLQMGILPTEEMTVGKGQKVEAYYLNRKQAIFITAKSETAEATDITIEIIERFDAYERGEVKPALPKTYAEALLEAGRLAQQLEVSQEREKLQRAELDAAQPKVAALTAISEARGDLGIRDTGRVVEVGMNRVKEEMFARKWACKEGRKIRPAHYGLTNKYCRLVERIYTDKHTGETCVSEDFKVTRRGIARLAEIFHGKNSTLAVKLRKDVADNPFKEEEGQSTPSRAVFTVSDRNMCPTFSYGDKVVYRADSPWFAGEGNYVIESLGRKTIAQVSYNRTAAQYRVRQLSPATEWLLSEAEFLRICRGAVTAHMKIVDKPLFDGAIIARSANTMRELRGEMSA